MWVPRIYEEVFKAEGFSLKTLAHALEAYEPRAAWRPLLGRPWRVTCGAYVASQRLLDVEGHPVGSAWRPAEPLALLVRLTLKPGQYATTALREVARLESG